jgi:hypothetical protein
MAFIIAAGLFAGHLLEQDTSHETGEENLNETIALKDVQKRGDARLNRIISGLRHSSMGEELYRYALNSGVNVAWENKDDSAAGSYYNETTLLTIDSRSSDSQLISVMAHELRHHWQFTATDINLMTLDPLRAWQTARLLEVDACAYTAKFATEYNEKSEKKIDLGNKYGSKTLAHYSKIPTSERDYIKDAVMPCFAEITTNDNYNKNHAGFTQTLADIYEIRYVNAVQSKDYDFLLAEYEQMPNAERIKTHFSQLLTSTLDPEKLEPMIRDASNEDFVEWINTATTNDLTKDILRLQRHFEKTRVKLMDHVHKASGHPAPAPSS